MMDLSGLDPSYSYRSYRLLCFTAASRHYHSRLFIGIIERAVPYPDSHNRSPLLYQALTTVPLPLGFYLCF